MQCWDAVIFDLDGTLWNPADGILAAWNRGFAAHGLAPFITKSHVEYWMGMLLPDIAAYILPDMDEGERLKLVMDCVQLENEYLFGYCYGLLLFAATQVYLESGEEAITNTTKKCRTDAA